MKGRRPGAHLAHWWYLSLSPSFSGFLRPFALSCHPGLIGLIFYRDNYAIEAYHIQSIAEERIANQGHPGILLFWRHEVCKDKPVKRRHPPKF